MTFSIITPSFSQSEWLKLCIASVSDQGVRTEHIVQDAGSTDGTLDWLPNDQRVRTFTERDQGIYDAIDRGVRRARGEILGFLNCDEQYLPGALRSVAAYFESRPTIQIAFGHVVVINAGGEYISHFKVIRPEVAHTWTCPLATLTCATFLRRRVVNDLRLFFDARWRYCGDAEWMLRVLQGKVRAGVINQFMSAYTVTGSNLSHTSDAAHESANFFSTAPFVFKMLRPVIAAHYRLRRLLAGAYFQEPFRFSVYTRESPESRITRHVAKPHGRWKTA